ncbi:unnamed protein product [Leptosia nina]|uniref:Uncharacterized protein n=1 Tax=Leptosia nina TaxID=320188 RepID=A0AAV1IU80_9NEOP
MIQDGLETPRPFEKIVKLGLESSAARVASRGAVADGFAEKRHPRRRQPVAAPTFTLTGRTSLSPWRIGK